MENGDANAMNAGTRLGGLPPGAVLSVTKRLQSANKWVLVDIDPQPQRLRSDAIETDLLPLGQDLRP